MYRKRIQNETATSRLTLPVVCFVSALLWFVAPAETMTTGSECSRYWIKITSLLGDTWAGSLVMLLLSFLNLYLLLELNNRCNLIRMRTHLTSSVFIILLASCAFMHILQPFILVQLFLLLFYHCIFQTYQTYNSVGMIFNSFMLVSFAFIFFPPAILLFPFMFISMFILQSLSLRTFFAMLIGMIAPFWFLAAFEIAFGDIYAFIDIFKSIDFVPHFDYVSVMQYQWICLAFVLIEFLIAWIHYGRNIFQDKIRSRAYFSIMSLMIFASLLLIVLYPDYFNVWFAVMVLNASAMISHHFALNSTKTGTYLYFISLIAVLLIATYFLWKPLLNFF